MNKPKSGEPVDLSRHMLATYQTLRIVLFAIALIFPWALWIGGSISEDHLELQGSMSAYYHANAISDREFSSAKREQREPQKALLDPGRGVMRNWFVGALFAIGALLIVYKGYRPAEDIALNLAGVFAVLVALFPMAWDEDGPPFHYIFAISFFVCIAYVCTICASATLPLVAHNDRRAYYRRCYKGLGYAMVASPITASVLSWLGPRGRYLFVAESCGVYAFAAYWLVKTIEIRDTDADAKAARGELQLPAGAGLADAVRDTPVIRVENV